MMDHNGWISEMKTSGRRLPGPQSVLTAMESRLTTPQPSVSFSLPGFGKEALERRGMAEVVV